MSAKIIALFSAVLLSGIMAHATPIGNWSSDHFVYSDSDGYTDDAGAYTITFTRDGDILSSNLFGNETFTIQGEQLIYHGNVVGSITDNAIIVEHIISEDEYQDDYSFSVILSSENEAEFVDKYIYGDVDGYYDSYKASLTRDVRPSNVKSPRSTNHLRAL